MFNYSYNLGVILMEVLGSKGSDISKTLYYNSFALCSFLAMETHHVLPLVNLEHPLDS